MIRFSLRCSSGHVFEAWFANNATFEKLELAGAVTCSECGDTAVEKALMAPAVRTGDAAARTEAPRPTSDAPSANLPAPTSPPPNLSAPASEKEAALAALRAKIEAVSDNVGRDFAAEARRIHSGDAPQRPILGEASLAEAKSLAA
ncbi:MAG: DUF1178 family protein, partial [Pseudomonadota bacterium]